MSKLTAAAPKPDDSWRIESDLNTLITAAQIKADPKRYAAVKRLAKEKAELMERTLGTEPKDKK